MKNSITIICLIFISQFSCNKDISEYYQFDAYKYSGLDQNAGNWKPILLSSGAEVGIPAAEDVSSTNFINELANLKTLSSNLSGEQKKAITFWGNNTIIRWNELARQLAAKYFLPPAPNADGTYSVPSSANPSVYPYFPFAHPPYTCRMFAYLSAAQFDALISTWHYKYQYNRPSPSKLNNAIVQAFPDQGLPSYPSEDAVIAAVSQTILVAMFPLEKDLIIAKATEAKNSRLWAGVNTQSDITAGDSLGRAVAAKFLSRAKTDGMSAAQTPKAISDSIRDAAFAKFGWSWKNLETPPRPVGITPFFGKVKVWNIPSVEAVRPGPPPAIGSDEFKKAVAELKDLEKNITDDQKKIAYFWGDGPSTYTPPGHWNRIASEKIVKAKMNPIRTARTLAYMNTAIMDAGVSCWDTKYYYHYPRPSQAEPSIKVLLGIPNFPSYTSGHSSFSGAGSNVLAYIFPESAEEFKSIAKEASLSRIYARIHYRFDSETGLTVGNNIGTYAVNKAKLDGAD